MTSSEESHPARREPNAEHPAGSIMPDAVEEELINEVVEDDAGEGERSETADGAPQRNAVSDGIRGERGIPSVNRERSIHSRVTNALAIVVMVVLGLGFLSWYYSAALKRRADEDQHVKDVAASRAAGEMKLPPLARIDPPHQRFEARVTRIEDSMSSQMSGAATDLQQPQTIGTRIGTGAVLGPRPVLQRELSPEEGATLRRLNSPVLYRPAATGSISFGNGGTLITPAQGADVRFPGSMPVSAGGGPTSGGSGGSSSLGGLLQATPTPAAQAQTLPTKRLLMPKGAFIDCTLETALNSQLPGMTSCITAMDIFGADGYVVLLERGSKLVGETRGETRLGQGRVFVLWTEARTPTGVVVQLASPGTDELGRSGLPGYVDTHFWERFGAAILISVIDGAIQAAVAGQNNGSGGSAVVYNAQGSRDVMTEVLRNTVNIPPTVVKNQGERIQVFVARDLDFRSVYSLGSRSIQ